MPIADSGHAPIHMGRTDNFDQVFKGYFSPLCYYAESFVQSKKDAEDIVEDLFFKLYKRGERFFNVIHAKAYLYQATKNACLNHIRNHRRGPVLEHDLHDTDIQSSEKDFLQGMIHTELIAEIYRAIQQLPPQCGKVITLAYLEDMNNEEIAKAMNISLQTVKNYKVRGLQILKEKFPKNSYALLFLLSKSSVRDIFFDHIDI